MKTLSTLALVPLTALGGGTGLVHLVLVLFFFCAFCAVVWWGFTRIAIPEPVKTIILVVLLLVALLFLWQMTMGGL